MLDDIPPETVNTRGARWNPPGVAAIYASLERATALAEAEHRFSVQPLRPSAKRVLYEIQVGLKSVLELTSPGILATLGLSMATFGDMPDQCAVIGGAASWLGHDGILVPSARAKGTNLIIYPNNSALDATFEVVKSEELPAT